MFFARVIISEATADSFYICPSVLKSEATIIVINRRSVAISHRRKDIKGSVLSFTFKKMAIRNLHLNKEIGSSFRFFPLFVLTELRSNKVTGQIFLLVSYACYISFLHSPMTSSQKR